MTEENKEVLEQVVQEPEVQEEPTSVQPPTKSNADHNWELANQVMADQKRQLEEMRQRVEALAKPKEEPEVDEFADLDKSDYITVEKALEITEKKAEKKAKQAAREMVEEYINQNRILQDESRMRSSVDDYDYVVNTFVLPMIQNNPALRSEIQSSKYPAEAAYLIGKNSMHFKDTTMKKETNPKAERILKNAQRPVSGNAVGSPLKTQASDFSKMSKDDVWKQSQEYARRA